jgi:hypothetical protein
LEKKSPPRGDDPERAAEICLSEPPPNSRAARPAQPRLRLRSWKRIAKPGSALIGVARVTLPIGGALLDIDDLPVLSAGGKTWAAWPGKPIVDAEGRVLRIPTTGKPRFVSFLHWQEREIAIRFSRAVVELVRQRDPEAFREVER